MQPSKLGAEYSQMLDSLPASETQVLSAARSLEVQGDATRACALLEEALRRHPSANLRKILAALHLKHGRFDASARVIEQVLRETPADVPSMLLLAEAQLKGGYQRAAYQTLQRAEQNGASKLRVFKLERQLDDTVTEPQGAATGPAPPNTRGLDSSDPSDSAVFEDESFSDLSSFELADGAGGVQDDDTPGIFDTLVDGYDDDPADRSFDDFLMDLGVPVDEETPTDPNRTSSIQVSADLKVAEQWGLDSSEADQASPEDATAAISFDDIESRPGGLRERGDRRRQHTPRLQNSPHFDDGSGPSGEFPDEKTEVVDMDKASATSPTLPSNKPSLQRSTNPNPPSRPAPSRPQHDRPQPNRSQQRQPRKDQPPRVRPQLDQGQLDQGQFDQGQFDQGQLDQGQLDQGQHEDLGPIKQPPSLDEFNQASDLGDNRRPLPPSIQQGRQSRRRPTGESRSIPGPVSENPQASPADDLRAATKPGPLSIAQSVPWKYVVPTAVALVVAIIGGVALTASSSAAGAAAEHLATYRSAAATDTYQGYLAGEQALEKALTAESYLGASTDALLSQIGLMGDARAARNESIVELAKLKAMLEYRYERIDTHQSRTYLERAEAQLSGAPLHGDSTQNDQNTDDQASSDQASSDQTSGDPRLDVARAYRLMAEGRAEEAAAMLEVTCKNFPTFADAATALLHAYLDDDSLQSASMTAAILRKLETPSVHQHYVLGLLESRQEKAAADARFRHIIETLSPDHLSARIARSYTLRRGDDEQADKEASALLEEVLGPLRASASPLQRAHAHIALGQLHIDGDARARGEEQFRKAIKVVPARSSVYVPLIELYRDDGRLDKSLELIDDAISQSANSPVLVLLKAEILRLTGHAEAALRALEDKTVAKEALDSSRAKWVEGMALLDLHRLDEASAVFEAATKRREEFSPARAYLLMSQEIASREERNEISSDLESMLEKFPTDPHVLRAGALSAMHVANLTRSRTARQELLERAKGFLEQAMDHGGNHAVLLFDLCRQQMLSGHGQDASISCRKAKRLNDIYLPGLLTMADLQRRRGHPDAAIELLSELGERFAEKPRISQMKADAHLERFEIDAAEKEINRWAGTPAAKSSLHHFVEGRLAFARDRYTSALGYFQRAHKNAPNDARAGLYYAHTLTRLGEHERAEKLVKRYLTDLEWEPVAWLVFGEIRRRQGRFSDARENLGLALQKLGDAIAPPWRTSQAYTQLAQTWADRYGVDHRYVGRYLYRGSKRGDETYPPLNEARGTYHLQRRRPDREKAAEAFEQVIAVAPYNCKVLVSLRALYSDDKSQYADALERVDKLHQEHCED